MSNQGNVRTGNQDEQRLSEKRFPVALVAVGIVLLVVLAAGVAFVWWAQASVPGTRLVYSIQRSDSQSVPVTSDEMVEPLRQRLRHSFAAGLAVNALDQDQVEVILPTRDPVELANAKRLLSSAGVLRFLPIANQTKHANLLKLVQPSSNAPSVSRDVLDENGRVVARWVTVGRDTEAKNGGDGTPLKTQLKLPTVRNSQSGEVLQLPGNVLGNDSEVKIARWMNNQNIQSIDVLAVIESDHAVGGEDLAFAAATFDQNGTPAVAINFNNAGSDKMLALTTANAPTGNVQTQLGIVLDDQLLTAPNILQPIRGEARITGNFTRAETDLIVQILKAGQLPAKLNPQPISETQVNASYRLVDLISP
ncbi:SecDF P1 head subdomain-containing protein [Novipirellula sp. SH528]|uniref:SecDF P1 head subdomain-containing protein n=1 Tax=Novipirellula sp. SH528 TaxID=3454466 RepID=UPI003F9EF4CC